jgi:hypothetical protein
MGRAKALTSRQEGSTMDDARTLLRHTVATLAYRAAKTVRGAPDEFAAFSSGSSSLRGARCERRCS